MKNPKNDYDFISGETLLVDKPADWTSFDVVNKIRGTLRRKLGVKKLKVGHSGTLDPMATGLLIICTGRYTKKLTELTGMDKSYSGTLKLGESTPSYDKESPVDKVSPTDHITEEMIREATQNFTGLIEQVPPLFSAIKVKGTAAYKLARRGEDVKLEARKVFVHRFEIKKIEMPFVSFKVDCGKGTYIRSLAHDMGKALHSYAHLVELRRTAIGEFKVEESWELDELIRYLEEDCTF